MSSQSKQHEAVPDGEEAALENSRAMGIDWLFCSGFSSAGEMTRDKRLTNSVSVLPEFLRLFIL